MTGRHLPVLYVMRVFTVLLLLLVGTVFVTSPAALLARLTLEFLSNGIWIVIILIYYLLATLLPIDKIIGRFYPVFGVVLIIMAVCIMGGISCRHSVCHPYAHDLCGAVVPVEIRWT